MIGISCERNRAETNRKKKGQRQRIECVSAKEIERRIDDIKTAIPTFRPCMALQHPNRIREYHIRTFYLGRRERGGGVGKKEEGWFYAPARELDTREGGKNR